MLATPCHAPRDRLVTVSKTTAKRIGTGLWLRWNHAHCWSPHGPRLKPCAPGLRLPSTVSLGPLTVALDHIGVVRYKAAQGPEAFIRGLDNAVEILGLLLAELVIAYPTTTPTPTTKLLGH